MKTLCLNGRLHKHTLRHIKAIYSDTHDNISDSYIFNQTCRHDLGRDFSTKISIQTQVIKYYLLSKT